MGEPYRNRFAHAPVIETRFVLQFLPLQGLRVGHFGLFWSECLGTASWQASRDGDLQAHLQESFGDIYLESLADPGVIDATPVRLAVRSTDGLKRVQFQADQLAFAFTRGPSHCPEYETVRDELAGLVQRLSAFTQRHGLPPVTPNLWSLTYVNVIPPGELWQSVGDWHQVFPMLFPRMEASIGGCPLSSFDGEWHFDMPEKQGRVHVRASKSASRRDRGVVLLVTVTARGAVDATNPDWLAGVEGGHDAAVKVFRSLASERAKQFWGEES